MEKQEQLKFNSTKVKIRRKELRLSQKELALKAITAREYISEIERGKVEPRVSLLARLATALKCSVDYFFTTVISSSKNIPVKETNKETNKENKTIIIDGVKITID